MKTALSDIRTTGNRKFTGFLAKQFVCDMLYPVYGESSVTTIFDGWQGKYHNYWSPLTNENRAFLEFFPEGHYVIRARDESKDCFQRRTPKSIEEFIDDMYKFGIQLYWSDWIVRKFKPKD